MKINMNLEIDTQNKEEMQIVDTFKMYWNLAKAYLPILATQNEFKEIIDAINECKPYCNTSVENKNNHIIYNFNYNDEKELNSTNTADAAATVFSLAAELLGGK